VLGQAERTLLAVMIKTPSKTRNFSRLPVGAEARYIFKSLFVVGDMEDALKDVVMWRRPGRN
jgi:hypothetical protein